jgi:hypothetical protein
LIPSTRKRSSELVAWFEASPYTRPPNWCTCLEEVINPAETDPEKWVFDLYLPIATVVAN